MSQGIRGANWVFDQKSDEKKSALKALAKAKAREKELMKKYKVYYERTGDNPPTWVRRVIKSE